MPMGWLCPQRQSHGNNIAPAFFYSVYTGHSSTRTGAWRACAAHLAEARVVARAHEHAADDIRGGHALQ